MQLFLLEKQRLANLLKTLINLLLIENTVKLKRHRASYASFRALEHIACVV